MSRIIYLVEDDAGIRELVIYTLRNTGFEARGFVCGEELWPALREQLPSLVILDIMLPGEDGLVILKRLRSGETTKKLPVMMLTAKGAEYDKVLGLDSGADDYMAKPAGMMELIARVKSLLRRAEYGAGYGTGIEKDEYKTGDLYVNIPRHIVMARGEKVTLTLKEFDLLVYLLRNPGIVLSRERILQAVWDYSLVLETRTVDTHILTLRTKLKTAGSSIKTVRGIGYKMEDPE
ncbi:MAG: response regulator transcription factor [Treponema sp.]|jgi:two-component system alkaline phosphatase synthesis response regulator PhoP|nr:response regulator transcription factor [Treponema sp.]